MPRLNTSGRRPRHSPGRWASLQHSLAARPLGRITLHLWCFLVKGGKWSMTRSGVARALRDMVRGVARRLHLRSQDENGGSHG